MRNQPGNQPAVGELCRSASRTANAIIKDQVTPMLFRKHIVSTRTLLQLAVAMVFFVGGVGAALAANSGIAPLLVPYTINTIAGNPDFVGTATTPTAGYFGEAVPATPTLANHTNPATLDGPYDMAVDSVGNVYITDKGNDIIREVNAQTGFITTIAGVIPKGCTGALCTLRTTGCADGVPASGAPLGSGLEGMAIDSYGNVFFDDNVQATVEVIYRGGAQVANFIKLENPTGVANSGGVVQPGYIYHVAGTVNLSTCTGSTGNIDNALAFQSAQLKSPALLSLDSAGNIYIADTGNATVRVINTQATTQTFFQYSVQPGFMRSITDCNPALTVPCPTGTVTSTANTGINGPVNAVVFNSQYKNATADAYGNVYQLNGTGGGIGPPGYYGGVAYAGGAPITNLLTAEAPVFSPLYPSPAMLPLTYGAWYDVLNNMTASTSLPSCCFVDVLAATNGTVLIRPASFRPDVFGTYWFLDTHFPELERVDQYTSLETLIIRGGSTTSSRATVPPVAGNVNAASFTNGPYYCVYGTSAIPWTQGPQTYDPWGDGCPAVVAAQGGNTASGPDALGDGLGNIYISDATNHIMRELPLGNAFPPTAVGTTTPVTQAIQVHFNATNPPAIGPSIPDGAATGNTTTAFSIAAGISDFTINTTTPEFPMGSLITTSDSAYGNTTTTANFAMFAGLPTCTKLGVFPTAVSPADNDYDCLVYVTFNPTAPGVRQSQLVVTTANGSVYNFSLSGVGVGGQLAIDGGAATPVATTGLGATAGVAVTQSGTVYIADPANNRVVVEPAGGGTQTTIGTGLSGPMGVAVDAANNVYISDTGNNRILKVDGVTGTQTVLGNNVWISGNAGAQPAQYAFNHPQGLAVDAWNNVYVADTGNKVVVEIPSNIALGGAVPLLAYSGAPKFIQPVAVAVDSKGNIYVADAQTAGGVIVKLPPGGGDLVNVPGSQFPSSPASTLLVNPNGVAVDAAGDVYVSDSSTNSVVEIPSAPGASTPFALNFTGLSAPAGLALDANGNLYVADSGNKQVLFENRQSPMVNFGMVPQNQGATAPLCSVSQTSDGFNKGFDTTSLSTCVLTVTNIGSTPVTLTSPITAVVGTGNPAYKLTDTCASPLPAGATCTIAPTFTPTMDNLQSESVSVNGGPQAFAMVANGEQPQAGIVLTSSLGLSPAAGGTTTITATVTQPFITGNTPTGTVTFTYVIDAANNNVNSCGTGGTVTMPLSGSGGTATATFNLPTLVQGVAYTVSANYNGDPLNSQTQATPILVAVPGIPVTATVTSTAAQLTFTYGQPAPVPVGTVTPTPAAPVTYSFTSGASATTPVANYPVTVVFSGTGACGYGFPNSVFSSGGAAIVTEKPATLTYTIPNFTAQYGAADLSYGLNGVFVGAVNGDTFGVTFTPPSSSVLNVGTYSVVPTVAGHKAGNYIITAPPSTLTITKAPAGFSISAAKTQVLNTTAGVASATFGISVSTLVSAGKGVPSGTVTVTDNFTPITSTGLGTPAAPANTVLTLVAGFVIYTPTSTAVGIHQYSFSYSGDANFQTVSLVPSSTAAPCAPSVVTANCLVVDNPDFTLTSLTGPVIVVPGVVPSGNGLLAAPNQQSSTPETAVLFVNGILGFAGQVSLSCQTQNPAYVSCFMTPPTVTVAASGTGITAATVNGNRHPDPDYAAAGLQVQRTADVHQ